MRKTIRFIIVLLAVGMMGYSANKLVGVYREYAARSKLYDDYANQFVNMDVKEQTASLSVDVEDEKAPLSIDFDSLLKENEDIVCWIYSEDSPINYPVVQSADNSYYLRRLLDGSYNVAGTIFMDHRNSPDFTDLNTIIYGHNMKNDTMFGTLKKYKNQEYYDKHPVVYLITPRQAYKVELIAGYVIDDASNIYNIPQTKEEQKAQFVKIKEQSTFAANTSFQEGDRLVTLSTCSSEFDSARFVLVGKIISF
ncbi:class B sortase [Bacillus sp. T3]|uniref:class B sortase n=1 Tax=Bacillus sp. T3 TaxID=467262 RepID=UPI0029825E0C|nr:class B sortase [Bacillus sp. T3]